MPEALRWLILLIGIVGLGFIFALVLRRLLQPDDDNTWDESRDSIFSTELLLAQLAKLVHSPGEIGNAKTFNPFLSLHNETAPRRIIRQLYQQLLADANRLNQPRRPAQTPSEYSRTLADQLPESREPLAQLTEQYLQARYAAEPPGTTQVETAQRAWVQLSISLNKAAQDPADRAT
jgi:hypothetical protein